MFKHNIIALVYDFDGTLSPKPMQEYTILPELKESPHDFWEKCQQQAKKYKADLMLTYMRLLIEEMTKKKRYLTKKDLAQLAIKIEYFKGVDTWFKRINSYVYKKFAGKVKLEHYMISAGLKEILNGVKIKKEFTNIFASEYYFDARGVAQFPTIVINDTAKTQYLFRINKGITDINESINTHMDAVERRIPFANIVYIGDGMTDVPCMTVNKNNGGHSMAVYNTQDAKKTCIELFKAGRIDYFSIADYSPCSDLSNKVELIINKVGANILFNAEKTRLKI